MAKQIFGRMQLKDETEQAAINRRLETEFGGESFSNATRQMWGLDKLDRSQSLEGNLNAANNLGAVAKQLKMKLSGGDISSDPHKIERRLMVLLDNSGSPDFFRRDLDWFLKMFAQHKLKYSHEKLSSDVERILSDGETAKREWASGFWGNSET